MSIDLNADLGEGGAYDAELLGVVSSCNIACGGHVGDALSMSSSVALALQNGVAIGAHPSYPDREGFGRRSCSCSGESLRAALLEQINALQLIVCEQGASIGHVKPHGALYNDAAVNKTLAETVALAICEAAPEAALVGLPASELQHAAREHGLVFIAEAFIDRAYQDNGRLLPRSQKGAVHTSLDVVVAQAVMLAEARQVATVSGELITAAADTLCVHGDTPGAAEAARAVRAALQRRGVEVRAVRR